MCLNPLFACQVHIYEILLQNVIKLRLMHSLIISCSKRPPIIQLNIALKTRFNMQCNAINHQYQINTALINEKPMEIAI